MIHDNTHGSSPYSGYDLVMMGMSQSQNLTQKVQEVMEKAKEDEVFLASLSREELERTGFDVSNLGDFEFVNIYLIYDDEEQKYKIKYIFDANPRECIYESEKDLGGREGLIETLADYLS